MKIQEIMERSGITQTGRAIAYIKDALEEINMIAETHVKRVRMNVNKDQRFYQIPNESIKIIDVRCKNHNNTDDIYKSIPRMIYQPDITDSDGE
jgi:hypothetical protein|tara:strand:+ start:401 stop:682 length:282 start_codon:yes stop_codon:yes gene_type:complete